MKIQQIDPSNYEINKTVIMTYESDFYYDLNLESNENGWKINLELKELQETYIKNWKEPLFSTHKKHCEFFFVFDEAKDPSSHNESIEIGYLTIGQDVWNKTLRIWDLYIDNDYKRKGIGTKLIKKAIQKSREYGCRALVLETQSSNYPAIQFYKKCGFGLIGFDVIAYSNIDIEKKEVRLELGLKLD
ncbi:MAG: Spermine/spermidine acetyltransferase [Candidatus Heimdallarchaeota archaeon LC_2]|nr:MAG: Spermine/spermidine acetyltransferase [Candidatus Heimdallarchaeota archaeon LC_2]